MVSQLASNQAIGVLDSKTQAFIIIEYSWIQNIYYTSCLMFAYHCFFIIMIYRHDLSSLFDLFV